MASLPSRATLAEVALWVVPAIWSSNYLVARLGADTVPPHVLAFGRWGVVFAVLLAWRGASLWRHRAVLRANAWRLLVLGTLGMLICGAWVYLAAQTTSATNIGLIYAAAPIGIALGSAWLLGEHLGLRQRWAMASALAGVLIVVFRGDPAAIAQLSFVNGDLWAVACTLAWIGYSLLLPYWRIPLPAPDLLCATAAAGLVMLAPFAAWEWVQAPGLTPRAWQLIVFAGLVPGLFAYLAYAFMQRELGAARAGLVPYLAPIYAALLAWLLLGEAPQWYHLLGVALILPGIRYSGGRR